MFINLVFPNTIDSEFTYSVPEKFQKEIALGIRVKAEFGNRHITGFVTKITDKKPDLEFIKEIDDVIDDEPPFNNNHFKFFNWISEYYITPFGDVLKNGLPPKSLPDSEKIILADNLTIKQILFNERNGKEYKIKILETLVNQNRISLNKLKKILKNKDISIYLNKLLDAGAISIIEEEQSTIKAKQNKIVKLNERFSVDDMLSKLGKRAVKQAEVLLYLENNKEKQVSVNEIIKECNVTSSVIKVLEEKELIISNFQNVERIPLNNYSEPFLNFQLTNDQQYAFNTIIEAVNSKVFSPILLYGVTASGKTLVYLESAKKVIEEGKQVLVLVPEISLTPQIFNRFFTYFGEQTVLIHSRLSVGERYDAWHGIISGKKRIILGPRSALFSPIHNLGMIVVDEEHDKSYKQHDKKPLFNARDAAVMLASIYNIPIVLGSATPSVESYYNAQISKYKLIKLINRIDKALPPQIKFIDLNLEKELKRKQGSFSRYLLEKIDERLKLKEGIILLQNRRGFATRILCSSCGNVVQCKNCSVAMVYHIKNEKVVCHYCGYSEKAPQVCPVCKSEELRYLGEGTQKIEDELQFHFPNSVIERVDSDSINIKGKYQNILNKFRNKEIDILVGTQIVSKGLDFPHVTLVGVISIESSLWMPDFRADERTFQLLVQVAGRSGRSNLHGLVLIQTYHPDNPLFPKAIKQDYDLFYNDEISARKLGNYPPFIHLINIELLHPDFSKLNNYSAQLYKVLNSFKIEDMEIYNPVPPILEKLDKLYRMQIMIKIKKRADLSGRIVKDIVREALKRFNTSHKSKELKLIVDVDPQFIS